MKYPLTICYLTSRKNCCFKWFIDSLKLQTLEVCKSIKIVVVDFHADMGRAEEKSWLNECGDNWVWTAPKPSVWQGEHRLTKENWFAASNARNCGLCLASDGWIAYVDDLSVLQPGWLKSIEEAMDGNYIVLGAYEKVRNMFVEKGTVVSCTHFPGGQDSRYSRAALGRATNVDGGWLYGCSLAGPVEAFLTVNGWPEMADGLGSEDYGMGICLENAGFTLKYDPRMMTLESEELHFTEPPMKRSDYGVSPNDKSHAALNMFKQSKRFENYFGEGGIRELRNKIITGEPFPVMGIPEHDWFTGKALSEL